MKTIKEKALIIQPKAADVARRIPQGIRHAAALGHSQTDRSEQDQDQYSDKPEDQVVNATQQSTLQATDSLVGQFKRGFKRSKNSFLTRRVRSNRVSDSEKSGIQPLQPRSNTLQPQVKPAQVKSAHFLQSQKSALISMTKTTRSMGQKIIASIKSLVTGLKGIGTIAAAGGGAAIALVIALAIIGWILTTPAGIFAGGKYEDNPNRSVYAVLDELSKEVDDRINEIVEEHSEGYDISIQYVDGNENILEQVGPLVLAVYAVKVSTDLTEPDQVTLLDERKEAILRYIFWQTVLIDYETHENTTIDTGGIENTTRHLKIKIELLSADHLISAISLSNEQGDVVSDLIESINFPLSQTDWNGSSDKISHNW